jgi:membrane-associated phospholipid phosphatase
LNILKDQGVIWTSPFHIKAGDLKVLLPLAAAAAITIPTDRHVLQDVVSHDADFNNANTDASNVMITGLLVTPAALYGVGHFDNNEHARETGLLGAEAIADGVVVEQGMKLIFWRERPNQGDGHGHFFETSAGIDSSFPSSHSVLAWSTAAVLAGEYRNPWAQALAYSTAAGISITRVLGQQHFPSDVVVGSAVGWLVGHYVYKHRHRWDAPRHFHVPR